MVIKGMATWLSWTEAGGSTQGTGLVLRGTASWPPATSMWGLYPVQVSLQPLAVFLAADVAGGGQVGEHLAEVLRDLPLEARRLRLPPLFVLAWTSAPARRG